MLLCASAASAQELRFKDGDTARVDWVQGPSFGQESAFQIQWFKDRDFNVTITMPDMPDMKNPPTQITRLVDSSGEPVPGSYRVSSIYFTMSGAWKVQVNVTYPDGSIETQVFDANL
jgi:hypothetical protein